MICFVLLVFSCLLFISARVFLVCVVSCVRPLLRNEEEYKLFDHYTWGMSPAQGGSLSSLTMGCLASGSCRPRSSPVLLSTYCHNSGLWLASADNVTWVLSSYWPGCCQHIVIVRRRGRGPLGTLYSACLDKHANKHINIQLGIFHAPWAEHTAVIRSPQPWSWGDILPRNPYLSWKPIFCSNIPYNSLILVEFLWFSPQKSWI